MLDIFLLSNVFKMYKLSVIILYTILVAHNIYRHVSCLAQDFNNSTTSFSLYSNISSNIIKIVKDESNSTQAPIAFNHRMNPLEVPKYVQLNESSSNQEIFNNSLPFGVDFFEQPDQFEIGQSFFMPTRKSPPKVPLYRDVSSYDAGTSSFNSKGNSSPRWSISYHQLEAPEKAIQVEENLVPIQQQVGSDLASAGGLILFDDDDLTISTTTVTPLTDQEERKNALDQLKRLRETERMLEAKVDEQQKSLITMLNFGNNYNKPLSSSVSILRSTPNPKGLLVLKQSNDLMRGQVPINLVSQAPIAKQANDMRAKFGFVKFHKHRPRNNLVPRGRTSPTFVGQLATKFPNVSTITSPMPMLLAREEPLKDTQFKPIISSETSRRPERLDPSSKKLVGAREASQIGSGLSRIKSQFLQAPQKNRPINLQQVRGLDQPTLFGQSYPKRYLNQKFISMNSQPIPSRIPSYQTLGATNDQLIDGLGSNLNLDEMADLNSTNVFLVDAPDQDLEVLKPFVINDEYDEKLLDSLYNKFVTSSSPKSSKRFPINHHDERHKRWQSIATQPPYLQMDQQIDHSNNVRPLRFRTTRIPIQKYKPVSNHRYRITTQADNEQPDDQYDNYAGHQSKNLKHRQQKSRNRLIDVDASETIEGSHSHKIIHIHTKEKKRYGKYLWPILGGGLTMLMGFLIISNMLLSIPLLAIGAQSLFNQYGGGGGNGGFHTQQLIPVYNLSQLTPPRNTNVGRRKRRRKRWSNVESLDAHLHRNETLILRETSSEESEPFVTQLLPFEPRDLLKRVLISLKGGSNRCRPSTAF